MLEFLKNRKKSVFILLATGFFAVGFFVGSFNNFNTNNGALANTGGESRIDMTPFWKTWETIDKKYPNALEATDKERLYGAISGLVDSLDDPYSSFFSPEESKAFQDDIRGNFGGVGMEVGIKDKVLTVISPLKDTPAYNAGIKSGDKIIKIDETSTNDLSIDKAIKLIRGEKGTEVSITIFRESEGKPREIKIIRDIINIPTLDTELRSDGIFVIKLYSFSANSSKLFKDAMLEFVKAKSDKLILDLRGNSGGYLEAAVNMASWFLPGGKVIVIEDYGGKQEQELYRSHGYNIFNDKLKFVVLIDQGSASASEILAGALQDYGKAKLVGEQSYGKGSVQEVIKITPDTLLKITVARWLTPKENSISEKGLTPDYKVPFTKDDYEKKMDPQMNKAVELLKNWPK